MILKVNSTPEFKLELKLDINMEQEWIEILVILENLKSHKSQMKMFHANDFKKALQTYNEWESIIVF